MKQTINKISEIVEFWSGLKRGYNNIENLLYMEQKLSGYSYYLAELLSEFKENYNIAYFWRKINTNKRKNAFIGTGKTAAASECMAIEKTEEELRKEIDAETIAYKAETLLKQVNKILDSMRTRISYLKDELKQTRFERNLPK